MITQWYKVQEGLQFWSFTHSKHYLHAQVWIENQYYSVTSNESLKSVKIGAGISQARIYLFIRGKKDGNSSDILKTLGNVK